MTNELLIEALDCGIKIQKLGSEHFLSCQGFNCEECKFATSNSGYSDHCRLIENGNYIKEENLKFLEENYPENLLRI